MLGVVSNAVEEWEEVQFWAEEAKNVLSILYRRLSIWDTDRLLPRSSYIESRSCLKFVVFTGGAIKGGLFISRSDLNRRSKSPPLWSAPHGLDS